MSLSSFWFLSLHVSCLPRNVNNSLLERDFFIDRLLGLIHRYIQKHSIIHEIEWNW